MRARSMPVFWIRNATGCRHSHLVAAQPSHPPNFLSRMIATRRFPLISVAKAPKRPSAVPWTPWTSNFSPLPLTHSRPYVGILPSPLNRSSLSGINKPWSCDYPSFIMILPGSMRRSISKSIRGTRRSTCLACNLLPMLSQGCQLRCESHLQPIVLAAFADPHFEGRWLHGCISRGRLRPSWPCRLMYAGRHCLRNASMRNPGRPGQTVFAAAANPDCAALLASAGGQ